MSDGVVWLVIAGDVDCGWLFVWSEVFGWDGRWVLVRCVRAVARIGLPSVAAGPGWGIVRVVGRLAGWARVGAPGVRGRWGFR